MKKPINLQDDENAHIDEEAPEVLRYIQADKKHRFMIDQYLNEEEGPVTFSLWR